MAKEHSGGGTHLGPVLSPMTEDFKPSDPHAPSGKAITNGVPGYPKGSERKVEEVTFYEGGNFGKFKRD